MHLSFVLKKYIRMGLFVALGLGYRPLFGQPGYWGTARPLGPGSALPHGGLFRTDVHGLGAQIVHPFGEQGVSDPGYGGIMQASNGRIYALAGEGAAGHGSLWVYDPIIDSAWVAVDLGTADYPYWGVGTGAYAPRLIEVEPGVLMGYSGSKPVTPFNASLFRFYTANDSIARAAELPVTYVQGLPAPHYPSGTLQVASDGKVYGALLPGAGNGSGIIRFTPGTNSYQEVVNNIALDQGHYPTGDLVEVNGLLYSTTQRGGPGDDGFLNSGKGVVFTFSPAGNNYVKRADLLDSARNPTRGFVRATNGLLYCDGWGSRQVSPSDAGVLFAYDPVSGEVRRVADYADTPGNGDDGFAFAGLLAASNGRVYGSFPGGLFEYDPVEDTVRRASAVIAGMEHVGTQAPLIETCRKPVYKPRSTSSFTLCAGSPFVHDLRNDNATSVVWRRNGEVVPARTDQRLSFAAITPDDAGTWACTLTNACGTTEPPPITIVVGPTGGTPLTIVGDTLLCGEADEVVLSGNSSGTWSTGATTPAITVHEPGTYVVHAQNGCGLTFSNSITVRRAPLPVAPEITNAAGEVWACAQNGVLLEGNRPDPWGIVQTGHWSTGAPDASIVATVPGSYYITYTNACGTDTSDHPVIVHIYDAPQVPVLALTDAFGQPADALLCSGDSVHLAIVPEQFPPFGYTPAYTWVVDGVLLDPGTTEFWADAAAPHMITALWCGATATAAVQVTVDEDVPGPAFILPDVFPLIGCDQDTAYLTSAAPQAIWQWTDGQGVFRTDTTDVLQVDWHIAGNGVYTLFNYNGCGTGEADLVQVQGIPAPEVVWDPSFDTICLGSGTVPLNGGEPAGGTYAGPGVVAGVFHAQDAGIGSHVLTYSYTNGGCTGYATATIVVDVCAGIGEGRGPGLLALAPNPGTEGFTVFIPGSVAGTRLEVMDTEGRVVLGQVLHGERTFVQAHALAAGTYVVQVRAQDGGTLGHARWVKCAE